MEGSEWTNKRRGMLTFQGSDLLLEILEVCLKALGSMKDFKKSFKIVAVFGLHILIPTTMDKIFDANSSLLVK